MADAGAPPRPEAAAAGPALLAPLQLLRVMLGVVLASQLWDNVSHDNFSADGFRRLAEGFAERNTAPAAWDDLMRALADHGALLGPLQAVGEAAIVACLLTGVAVAPAAFAFAGLLAALTLSELGIYWPWELPPLVAMALAVGIAFTPPLRAGLRAGLLARPTAGGALRRLGAPGRVALGALVGVAAWGLLHASEARSDIAIPTGLTVGALLALAALLDALAARRGGAPRDAGAATIRGR